MRVVLTRGARRDLQHIHDHIAADSPKAAARMAIRLVAACDALEDVHDRGRPGRRRGTREVTTVRPYVIVYRIRAEITEVLRIWHGAQDR